jgi:hypothetical protein
MILKQSKQLMVFPSTAMEQVVCKKSVEDMKNLITRISMYVCMYGYCTFYLAFLCLVVDSEESAFIV